MADAVILSLPALDLDIIGWENDAAISGSVVLVLPAISANVGSVEGARLSVPAFTLSVAGFAGVVTYGADLRIRPTLAIAGSPGVYGSVKAALPSLTLGIGSPDQLEVSLPAPQLEVEGLVGADGFVPLIVPAPTLAVVGSVQFVAAASLNITPRISVSGTVGAAAGINASLRALALATSGHTGALGTVQVTLPVYALTAGGTGPLLGEASLTLPMLVLEATGQQRAVDPAANVSTMVMHTETQALTTYTEYPFNSFARFNGVYLGAKDDGIFALTGASDAGEVIEAYARMGTTDMATSHLKRVERCYVGYQADGDMVLRVTTEGAKVRDYRINATAYSGTYTNMVKLGRGVEARYWQFELRNTNGSDFQLDTLEVKPTVLARRLWGKP